MCLSKKLEKNIKQPDLRNCNKRTPKQIYAAKFIFFNNQNITYKPFNRNNLLLSSSLTRIFPCEVHSVKPPLFNSFFSVIPTHFELPTKIMRVFSCYFKL